MNFPATVMIVDDEAHVRTHVSLLLKQIGVAKIVAVPCGEEAVAIYPNVDPDLVLLDVFMPGMDGLETLRQLKQIDPTCVVVMLTTNVVRHRVEKALDLGATYYISKDLSSQRILEELTETIEDTFNLE
ncbi:response regulator transcription factor [Synoicihabitans lomoniglobus]|uniref:Response regulator transcription factor n=1 Tax=Synoicihabitans lomoniglobus TaxID=2909285 RepID=A0AAF0CRB5_9BACT|nr:response regulator transcription factor [Opitutaceae bacterium LMO-M01]WED66531.1 response regulator transcription factor [Opitutaceae bacterium LMO-M01]